MITPTTTPGASMKDITPQKTGHLSPSEIREGYSALMKVTLPQSFMDTRNALARLATAERVTPKAVLESISKIPAARFLLDQDCRIPEGYLIGEHESCWLSAFERYIANSHLPLPLKDSEIRLLGVLHDLGKPLPDSKSDQSNYTLQVITDLRAALPVDQNAFRIICSIIGNDPLGKFIVSNFERQATMDQRKALAATAQSRVLTIDDLQRFSDLVKLRVPDESIKNSANGIANEIKLRAKALNIPAMELYNLHLVSYLLDVASYTYDAIAFNGSRSKPGIEFVFALNPKFKVGVDNNLFIKDPASGIMKLSRSVHALLNLIEIAILAE